MYVTWYHRQGDQQFSFEEQYLAMKENRILIPKEEPPYPRTQTTVVPDKPPTWMVMLNMIAAMAPLVTSAELQRQGVPYDNRYTRFAIPKRSGGYRQIAAPDPMLLTMQQDLVHWMQYKCKLLSHDAAFAYVPKRCAKHAIQVHQQSRWFLKLDIKDFFPSWTKEHVISHLRELYPFAGVWTDLAAQGLELILDTCFLEGVLPQGSAASPFLSNVCMTKYDQRLTVALRDFDRHNFRYTRYADDLLISCPYDFDKDKVIAKVREILPEFLVIKDSKTRYGSSSGSNWNLGLMLNKDQQITVGHKRKEKAKAIVHNLMRYPTFESRQEIQVIQGELAYIESIEPRYMQELDTKYRTKFHCAGYKEILSIALKTFA